MIPELEELLKLFENVIYFEFILSITKGYICSDNEPKLLSLPTRYEGLAIPRVHEIASYIFQIWKFHEINIIFVPADLRSINIYHVNKISQRKIKSDIRSEREHCYKNTLNELHVSDSQTRLSQEKGVSKLTNIPSVCAFGHKIDMQHTMSF